MIFYVDLKLFPDEEIPIFFIRNKVYTSPTLNKILLFLPFLSELFLSKTSSSLGYTSCDCVLGSCIYVLGVMYLCVGCEKLEVQIKVLNESDDFNEIFNCNDYSNFDNTDKNVEQLTLLNW
jgi:hypothetical protein